MESKDFVKKVCLSNIAGPNRRDRPLGSRKDKVKEYMREALVEALMEWGLNKQGGSILIGRGRASAMAIPFGEASRGRETYVSHDKAQMARN